MPYRSYPARRDMDLCISADGLVVVQWVYCFTSRSAHGKWVFDCLFGYSSLLSFLFWV
jgi:hypothetical protein